MDISTNILNKLRDTIRISDIVSKKIKLQKRGKDFFGLCPFHKEKTPSFSVNNEKNFYYCFGCGAQGDAIKFIQETHNLNFVEAVKLIADEYNIKITFSDTSQNASKDIRLLEINKSASLWFHKVLYSQNNTHVLNYLAQRNITTKCINTFLIGYAPSDRTLLPKYLQSLGYTFNEIKESGLIKDITEPQLCRFKNRIIFPINNAKGETIAFGGRTISNNELPKYLNSPETLIFKKRYALYLEEIALKKVNDSNTTFIVEGYTDAISMHSIGLKNTVATLGTSISEFHIMKLWKKKPCTHNLYGWRYSRNERYE